jgi:hypothetical protein
MYRESKQVEKRPIDANAHGASGEIVQKYSYGKNNMMERSESFLEQMLRKMITISQLGTNNKFIATQHRCRSLYFREIDW